MPWLRTVFAPRAQAKVAFAARRIGAALAVCVPFTHVNAQQRQADLLITNASVIDVQTCTCISVVVRRSSSRIVR